MGVFVSRVGDTINHLTFTDETALQTAVDAILERYAVTGLLTVELQCETEHRTARAYRGVPARSEERHRYIVKVDEWLVERNCARLKGRALPRFGCAGTTMPSA